MHSLIIVTILMSIPLTLFIANEIADYFKTKRKNIETFIELHQNKVDLSTIIDENKNSIEKSMKILREIDHKM
jgi:hypothetical protein